MQPQHHASASPAAIRASINHNPIYPFSAQYKGGWWHVWNEATGRWGEAQFHTARQAQDAATIFHRLHSTTTGRLPSEPVRQTIRPDGTVKRTHRGVEIDNTKYGS